MILRRRKRHLNDHVEDVAPETVSQRAENGAAMLDSLCPGWHHQIDLDELHMGRGPTHVLGQLYATIERAQATLGISEYEMRWGGMKLHYDETSTAFTKLWQRGIRIDLHLRVFDELNQAWRREVRKRLSVDNSLTNV